MVNGYNTLADTMFWRDIEECLNKSVFGKSSYPQAQLFTCNTSVKATVENPWGSVEKLSHKDRVFTRGYFLHIAPNSPLLLKPWRFVAIFML